MSFSGPVTIAESHGYRLDSYGNGAAYALRNIATRHSVWVQGDDAIVLREALDSIERNWPNWSQERVLECLWNDYGYELAATPDEKEISK